MPTSWIRLVALSLLVAYVVAFVLENAKHVHVHFVFVTTSVSLIWVKPMMSENWIVRVRISPPSRRFNRIST